MLYLFLAILLSFIGYLALNGNLSKMIEGFASGSLIQLTAKGPQDTYLTSDAEKYMRYYYGPYYNEFIWNNGTRIPRYNYGYYPLFPYTNYYNYYNPYYSPYYGFTFPTSHFTRTYYK